MDSYYSPNLAIQIKIGAKTSSTGKIFDSVNTIQIAEALSKKGFDMTVKKSLSKAMFSRKLANNVANIKLHREVVVSLKFKVVAE